MATPHRLTEAAERLVLAAQAASPTVRLVGGAGLALLLGHRHSDDLDLFSALREDIRPIVLAIEEAAQGAGCTATRVRTGPSFARLEIVGVDAPLRVDVASDSSPRIEPSPELVGAVRVETLRDQRANKIIALLGRSELRDLVDLYFIEQAGLPVLDGFQDAVVKDSGMDPAWFAWALAQIEIRPLSGMIVPLDLAELARFRDRLVAGALDVAGAGVPG